MNNSSQNEFYKHFLSLGEIPCSDIFSEDLLHAISIQIGRNLDFETISLAPCGEVAALIVLGLVSEGWMIYRPISGLQNSPMTENYQYIQNTILVEQE